MLPPSGTYASSSSIATLQLVHNAALRNVRIATGPLRMASVDHLHSETQFLPVKNGLELRWSQYLASALRPCHPSHKIVVSESGPRRKKETLLSIFIPSLSYLTLHGIGDLESYRQVIRSLHTAAVAVTISSATSGILGHPPPDIDSSETNL